MTLRSIAAATAVVAAALASRTLPPARSGAAKPPSTGASNSDWGRISVAIPNVSAAPPIQNQPRSASCACLAAAAAITSSEAVTPSVMRAAV